LFVGRDRTRCGWGAAVSVTTAGTIIETGTDSYRLARSRVAVGTDT
jgi:hypothetical protein